MEGTDSELKMSLRAFGRKMYDDAEANDEPPEHANLLCNPAPTHLIETPQTRNEAPKGPIALLLVYLGRKRGSRV